MTRSDTIQGIIAAKDVTHLTRHIPVAYRDFPRTVLIKSRKTASAPAPNWVITESSRGSIMFRRIER